MKKNKTQLFFYILFCIIFSIILQLFFIFQRTKSSFKKEAQNNLLIESNKILFSFEQMNLNSSLNEGQLFYYYDQSNISIVDNAISLIDHFQRLYQKGLISKEQAQKDSINLLRDISHEKSRYFWIDTLDYKLLLFPPLPEKEGSDLNEKETITSREIVDEVKEKGYAFKQYNLQTRKDSNPRLERAYVKLYEPWNWAVGISNSLEDLNKISKEYNENLKTEFQNTLAQYNEDEIFIAILERDGLIQYCNDSKLINTKLNIIETNSKENLLNIITQHKKEFLDFSIKDSTTSTIVAKMAYIDYIPQYNSYILIMKNENQIYQGLYSFSNISYKDIITWGFLLSFAILCLYFWQKNIGTKDYLTTLYNREKIKSLLEKKILTMQKRKSHGEIFFMLLDVEQFSTINKKYGTFLGDEVLRKISFVLKYFKKKAYIARIKGDDFFILFKEENKNSCISSARNIFNSLNGTGIDINGENIKIKINALFTKWDQSENITDAENIISSLEKNLYVLKNSSHETSLHIFENLKTLLEIKETKLEDKNILLDIIQNDRILPFFQPIYNLQKQKIEKYEVLMRIRTENGYDSPYRYILMAEENDLIKQMDQIVIQKALHYKKRVKSSFHLSINISGKELDYDFLNQIWLWVKDYELNPQEIIIELTETSAIKNVQEVSLLIQQFREKGFRFAIDDFGTGFSGMYYLRNLPVDVVKIDGSFVKDMDLDEKNYYIVHALTSMAKAFKMKVVAEFVENKNILDLLNQIDVNYAQGYYIGKPEPYFIENPDV